MHSIKSASEAGRHSTVKLMQSTGPEASLTLPMHASEKCSLNHTTKPQYCPAQLHHCESPGGGTKSRECCAPDTSIAHNADGHACGQTGQPTRKSSSQVCVPIKQVIWLVSCLVDCGSTAAVMKHRGQPGRVVYTLLQQRGPPCSSAVQADQCALKQAWRGTGKTL